MVLTTGFMRATCRTEGGCSRPGRTSYRVEVSGWRRCEGCRKVKAVDEYDGEASICRACQAGPPPRAKKASPAVSRRVTPTAAPAAPRRPSTGAIGSGDVEARERRAKRMAWEQLAELHEEEYEQLLQTARRAEGLRT
jgi:hypothetical protein